MRRVLRVLRTGLLLVAGCGGMDEHDGMDGMSMNPACVEDATCESMGPGNMCMGGMCMVMNTAGPTVVQPAPSEQETALRPLTDINPDPLVFEANLIAEPSTEAFTPGHATPTYRYRDAEGSGSIPGPLIDVAEGTEVRIHLQNLLPESTTIHWHGLVLPPEMDGVPDMPVAAIAPGASYTYAFTARHPGLYWYHPHQHSEVEVEQGLYGALVIRPAAPGAEPSVTQERIFMVDDLLLDGSGNIAPADTGSAHLQDPATGEVTMTFDGMMGRQGNRLLLNGKINPILHVRPGSVERWRFINSANARFFRLKLPGLTIVRIGGDSGPAAAATEADEILLANGQRVDLLVRFDLAPGASTTLVTSHYNRGHDMADPGDLPLALVVADGAPVSPPQAIVPPALQTPPSLGEVQFTQRVEMTEVMVRGGRIGFAFNGQMWPDADHLHGTFGRTERWEVTNLTHMDHPFHLHGTRFQVVSAESEHPLGLAAPNLGEWADTAIVPALGKLTFVTRFEDYPGEWMFHCHIFEHAERGMMGAVSIE